MHGRALAALRAAAPNVPQPARLAHHAEQAGDAAAVRQYAAAAADQAAGLGAHREAAMHYARAVRYADAFLPEDRVQLYVRASESFYLGGPIEEAVSVRRAAIELRRSLGDRLGEGADLTWLSWVEWAIDRTESAHTTAQSALRLLEPLGPSPQLAIIHTQLAQLASVGPHPSRAREHARRPSRSPPGSTCPRSRSRPAATPRWRRWW